MLYTMQVIYKCEFVVYYDCLGAIDDIHVHDKVYRAHAPCFRRRKIGQRKMYLLLVILTLNSHMFFSGGKE